MDCVISSSLEQLACEQYYSNQALYHDAIYFKMLQDRLREKFPQYTAYFSLVSRPTSYRAGFMHCVDVMKNIYDVVSSCEGDACARESFMAVAKQTHFLESTSHEGRRLFDYVVGDESFGLLFSKNQARVDVLN